MRSLEPRDMIGSRVPRLVLPLDADFLHQALLHQGLQRRALRRRLPSRPGPVLRQIVGAGGAHRVERAQQALAHRRLERQRNGVGECRQKLRYGRESLVKVDARDQHES